MTIKNPFCYECWKHIIGGKKSCQLQYDLECAECWHALSSHHWRRLIFLWPCLCLLPIMHSPILTYRVFRFVLGTRLGIFFLSQGQYIPWMLITMIICICWYFLPSALCTCDGNPWHWWYAHPKCVQVHWRTVIGEKIMFNLIECLSMASFLNLFYKREYRQLRARRALLPYRLLCTAIAPFWFSSDDMWCKNVISTVLYIIHTSQSKMLTTVQYDQIKVLRWTFSSKL